MFTVLFTALLSFNLLSTNLKVTKLSSYIPEINVETGTFEVDWWREGVIGRHQMVSFDSIDYLGAIEVKKLSRTYDSSVLDNFHFTESVEILEEDTISLTISETSKFISTLGVKAGLNNIEISDKYTLEQMFKIEGSNTYTISNKLSYKVEYDVKSDVINGQKFYLAEAAYVYKINCQKWQYDNYWWNNYEVSGSRKSFTSYLSLDAYVTVALEDGTLL